MKSDSIIDRKTVNRENVAAFFDFDRTLIEVESGRMALKWMREQGIVMPGYIMKILAAIFLYRLNLFSEERMVRTLLTFYRDKKLSDFQPGSEGFYRDYLRPYLAPNIVDRVHFHREKGHLLVMVSGSLRYLLEPVVKDLGFDHLFCTDLEVGSDGLLTGRPRGQICVDAMKKRVALEVAEKMRLNLAQCFAYGDHRADIPLLELVGYPHAVEPDAFLQRIAAERGWPVLSHR